MANCDSLRALRQRQWPRMVDLAARIDIHVSTLSRYERHLREPRGPIRARLAAALGISEEQLVACCIAARSTASPEPSDGA